MNELAKLCKRPITMNPFVVKITEADFNTQSALSAFIMYKYFRTNIIFTTSDENIDVELNNCNVCERIWSSFGKDIIKANITCPDETLINVIFENIKNDYMQKVDKEGTIPCLGFVELFKLTWLSHSCNDKYIEVAIESNFNYLVRTGSVIVEMIIEEVFAREYAKQIITEAFEDAIKKNSSILEIDDSAIPWKETVAILNSQRKKSEQKIDFVICKSLYSYYIHIAPNSTENGETIFPKEMLNDSYYHLASIIGITSIKFIDEYTAITDTKENAYAICQYIKTNIKN